MAAKRKLSKMQNGGPTPTVQDTSLFPGDQIAAFLGLGTGIGLLARKQNRPMTAKQKERLAAKDKRKAERKKSNLPEQKKGGNWIQGAIKKPGALREQLGVKKGETIPKAKLAAAAKKGGKLGQRARLAITLSKMRKK
jgi:hypothetical protein